MTTATTLTLCRVVMIPIFFSLPMIFRTRAGLVQMFSASSSLDARHPRWDR